MIHADALTKQYGAKKAVDGLSFVVRPGVVTGFLGPNGAGKSTTMRMVLGLDAPTAGRVTVNGRRYADSPAPMHEVGALLEARAVHPGRSAYDHLLALGATVGIGRRRVQEVIELVGLGEVARRRAGSFSLGMGQRLGIASALLADPQTLMLDEPVNGLDPDGIVWIRTLLRDLAAEGRTVLLSSHLMSEMALTADHLIIIGRGRLLRDMPLEEFIEAAAPRAVTVRTPEPARLRDVLAGPDVTVTGTDHLHVHGLTTDQIGTRAAAARLTLLELSGEQVSLEQAYMELTDDTVEYRGGSTPATPSRHEIPTGAAA